MVLPPALCPSCALCQEHSLSPHHLMLSQTFATYLGLPPGSVCPSKPHLPGDPLTSSQTLPEHLVDSIHGWALGPRELMGTKAQLLA